MEESGGMVGVMKAKHPALLVEEAAGLINLETMKKAGNCQLENEKEIEVHTISEMSIGWSLNPAVLVKLFRHEHQGMNEAVVLLLPKELPVFTRTIIEHPMLLPTSYSQSLSVEGGGHYLRLASKEPFINFIERLSDVLSVLRKGK